MEPATPTEVRIDGRRLEVARLQPARSRSDSPANVMLHEPVDVDAPMTPQTIPLASLEGKFETSAYLSPYSDVAALMATAFG